MSMSPVTGVSRSSATQGLAQGAIATTLQTKVGANGRRRMSTPLVLQIFLFGIWGFAALLFLVGEGALSKARHGVQTVAKDTAPSIMAAQEISFALADMDANAANYLLGTMAHQVEASKAFEERRVKVSMRLVDAAQNITYGDAERVPVRSLFDMFGRYLELVAQAHFEYNSGDLKGAIRSYGVATDMLHAKIWPAASALDNANKNYMNSIYTEQQHGSAEAEVFAVLVGGILIALLLGAQGFLCLRMHRIFNVHLLMATLFAIGLTAYLVLRFQQAREDLRVAKEDAFESIHALSQMRAIAYDANGDESRYLLDIGRRSDFEQAFHTKVARLTSDPEPDPHSPRSGLAPHGNGGPAQGLFGTELHNITFSGEREAALAMVSKFARYHAIDRQLRTLEHTGKHEEAIELCIGTKPNQSNAAFAAFDAALQSVIDINQQEFDRVTTQADKALQRAALFDPILALLIALLGYLGLRPRLREYAVLARWPWALATARMVSLLHATA